MVALIQTYQKAFSMLDFKRVLLAVAVILLFSSVAGIFVQLAFQQFCATRLSIILLSGAAFWILAGPYIFDYATTHFSSNQKFWTTVIGSGLGTVALNQAFVFFSMSFLMSSLYGCVDQQNNWLQNILTNNIVINSLCYAGFVGAGIFKRNRADNQTKPQIQRHVLMEPYIQELIIKNGSTATKVPVNTIQWIEADNKCISIIGESYKYVVYRSLKSIEPELDPAQFARIHRSTIINKTYLTKLHSLPTGDALAEMKSGAKLRVSRNFKMKEL